MCFDNNNCSCLWLIIILVLLFCCCGSGNEMAHKHSEPDAVQAKAQRREDSCQRHAHNEIVEHHAKHAFCWLAESVQAAEKAICDGVEHITYADNAKVAGDDLSCGVAVDKEV